MNLVVKIILLTLCGMALSCSRQAADPVSPDGPSEDGKLPSVTLTTFAGTDTREGYANGKGTAAQFSYPCQLTIDKNDNLYVIDQLQSYYGGSVIRKIDPAGNVTIFARGLGSITDLCVDPRDGLTIYAIECGDARGFDNGIFRISSAGQVTRLSGGPDPKGGYSFGFRDGPLAQAKFNKPTGIAMDKAGNLYIADELNRLIRKVNLATGTVSTLAGQYRPDDYACNLVDGKSTAAQFCTVNNLTLDESGNLYLPDYNNHAIRQITPDGTVSTYIGMGTGYNKDCRLGQAKVFWPSHVAFDPIANNCYLPTIAVSHSVWSPPTTTFTI
ncbi:hypothetical protein [Spirosoma panaciterrae]|uniref:hypothetical protein n=1 Tax=Spirosoma panaciterrae TaxID=496058 RepID=UPI000374AC21|nr:hypothetical protein [Spirosoma panaciterrae]